MIKEIEERHQREKESNSCINEQQCFDDREYLLSLVKRQREALKNLDRAIKFDYEQETWVDEERLKQCTSGMEMTILINQIEHVNNLNAAKKIAREALKE